MDHSQEGEGAGPGNVRGWREGDVYDDSWFLFGRLRVCGAVVRDGRWEGKVGGGQPCGPAD